MRGQQAGQPGYRRYRQHLKPAATYKGRAKSSKYNGVTRLSERHKSRPWRAQIVVYSLGRIDLGTWETEEDAARAYDEAARIHYGEAARLNFPEETGV